MIRYVLSDTRVGQVVLTQDIETSALTSEDSTPGAALPRNKTAISRAAFRAAGKNIDQLLATLWTIKSP